MAIVQTLPVPWNSLLRPLPPHKLQPWAAGEPHLRPALPRGPVLLATMVPPGPTFFRQQDGCCGWRQAQEPLCPAVPPQEGWAFGTNFTYINEDFRTERHSPAQAVTLKMPESSGHAMLTSVVPHQSSSLSLWKAREGEDQPFFGGSGWNQRSPGEAEIWRPIYRKECGLQIHQTWVLIPALPSLRDII